MPSIRVGSLPIASALRRLIGVLHCDCAVTQTPASRAGQLLDWESQKDVFNCIISDIYPLCVPCAHPPLQVRLICCQPSHGHGNNCLELCIPSSRSSGNREQSRSAVDSAFYRSAWLTPASTKGKYKSIKIFIARASKYKEGNSSCDKMFSSGSFIIPIYGDERESFPVTISLFSYFNAHCTTANIRGGILKAKLQEKTKISVYRYSCVISHNVNLFILRSVP